MDEQDTEANSKWHPVIVMLRGGGRLECQCGALALIITGKLSNEKAYNQLEEVDHWCQSCYLKAQQKEIEQKEGY